MNVSGIALAPSLLSRDMMGTMLAAAQAKRTENTALSNLPVVPAVPTPGGLDGSQVDLYL